MKFSTKQLNYEDILQYVSEEDLVQQKCKQIVDENYKDDRGIYIIISQMYQKGYILTLIRSNNEKSFDNNRKFI